MGFLVLPWNQVFRCYQAKIAAAPSSGGGRKKKHNFASLMLTLMLCEQVHVQVLRS